MARAAGLAGRGAWRAYPRALLVARASTDACRMVFPDVVKGLGHVPDTSDAVAVDWDELATSTGLPDEPAPTPARQLQWKGARRPIDPEYPAAGTVPQPEDFGTQTLKTPSNGPVDVPWGDDAAEPPPAVESPPTAPEAAAPTERPVDSENVRRIMAAYGDLGYDTNDRPTRLALFSAVLGYPVASTNDLERMDALRLYGALGKLRDGTLLAIADGHGGFTIHAGQEPEGEGP